MSSLLRDGWKYSYWKEIFGVKIPRHLARMRKKMRRGKSVLEVSEDEIVEEFKEGPMNWG